MDATGKAAELLRLHTDPELLVLVNVWDVASARVVTGQPGCKALATASAAIAASFGYPDGEHLPLDLVFDMTARIVEATELPATPTWRQATATSLPPSPGPSPRVWSAPTSRTRSAHCP